MKKLLFITCSFPPLHGPESTMTLNHVKYLTQQGWAPIVLSIEPSAIEATDYSGLSEIPSNVTVYRTSSVESLILSLLRKMKSLFASSRIEGESRHTRDFGRFQLRGSSLRLVKKVRFLPNRKTGWMPFALVTGLTILRKQKIEAIFSRSGPITCHILALIFKFLTDIPWVASFSDPWTTDPNNLYQRSLFPERVMRRYDELLESKILHSADEIVLTTDILKNEYTRRFRSIPSDKFFVVPNSYDPCDISIVNRRENEKKLVMTYAGNLMNQRSPEPLFKALRLLKKEEDDIETKVEVRLVGKLDEFKHLISKYRLDEMVKVVDSVPHKEVFHYLHGSDILLLIDAPRHGMCLPSKLVEYIFVGKPILGITSEEGSAAAVIRRTKTGIVVSPYDVKGIKNAIKSYYSDYVNGDLIIEPDWSEIGMYTAERCAGLLAKAIEKAS